MSYCLYTLVLLVVAAISGGIGFVAGNVLEKRKWLALRQVAIAGQRLWVDNLGEVFILGYSEDEEFVDVVPEEILNGKWPADIDQDVLDRYTISIPVNQFLTQVAPNSVKQAARI